MINIIKKLWNNQGLRYVFFGGCTTLVNLLIFNVLVYACQVNYTISNIISVASAIVFAFVVNKIFVFVSKSSSWKEVWIEFCRFVLGRLSTMIIEVGGVFVLVQYISQAKWLAKLETQIIVTIVNYFISKFLVFKETNIKNEADIQ